MVTVLIAIMTLLLLLKLYISVMQIGYINQTKRTQPVLMRATDFLQAGNYSVAREKLSMATAFVEYLMLIVWLGGGLAWMQTMTENITPLWQSITMVIGFVLINGVIMFPLEWYGKFVLDQKFGFNRSSMGLFLKDTMISTLLTVMIGGLIFAGVYWIISSFSLWWLWSFIFLFAIIILINMLFPTIRALFFDKLTPLDDPELNGKITELMQQTGFQSSGVFISDASKRDARLNAYFGGLGKSKRVVLFDTLLETLTPQELLAVLGHELGHFAHGDLYKNIGMIGLMLLAVFAIFGHLPASLFSDLHIQDSPAMIMILFLLLMPLVSQVMMPLMGLVSRHNEYAADETGAALGGKMYLAEALKKLVSENRSFPLSHPLYRFFYTTHPPVLERLKALGYEQQVDTTFGSKDTWATRDA
jgi:STE24 endopeptidase